MNNKTNKKLLVLSVLFILFGAAITLANSNNNNFLNVKPVLNRAIQTIQKIAFNVDAIRHPEALDREVIVESNHGTVLIRGRVRALVDGTTGYLAPDSTGSSLFYGRNNYLEGTDSYIVGGENNKITHDVSESAIIGGTNNTLITGSSIFILGGSGNSITGVNSYIVGGKNNHISGNNSYIIGGRDSTVTADRSVAAGSDIVIDKEHVFAWKDTSDDVKLNPKKSDTFILFAQNGMSIGYDIPENVLPGTVNIKGVFQVSTEKKACGINIAGAIQYIPLITGDVVGEKTYAGELYGCYCSCDGSEWVSMIPSALCRTICPAITGAVDDDFQNGVCRYKWSDQVSIWGLDESQACDNGEAKDFSVKVDAKTGYPSEWHWNCAGNKNSTGCPSNSDTCPDGKECGALAQHQTGECSKNPKIAHYADYYNKCASGYPSKIHYDWNTALYTWDCLGINGPDSGTHGDSCKACKENWQWDDTVNKCVNKNGRCNSNYNGKNLGELKATGRELCEYVQNGITPVAKETYKEDGSQEGWEWICDGEQSDAKCHASYRVDPGRCEYWWDSNIRRIREISPRIGCWNGELTGLTQRDENNLVHWTCAGVNDERYENCQGCPSGYKYNRDNHVCEKICCEYETGYTYNILSGTITLNTCHTSLTLMDKNLGATEVWYFGDENLTSEKVGNYYQRGNNYGFSVNYGNNKIVEATTTDRPTWNNVYNRSGYYGEKFIVSNRNEDQCLSYNYWTRPDGTCTIHRDIWGGGIDGWVAWNYGNQFGMDTMYTVHSNDIKYFLYEKEHDRKKSNVVWSDYVLNTGALARKGPCPDGWHVPSAGEWGALLDGFCKIYPHYCIDYTDPKRQRTSLEGGILTHSVKDENLGNTFSKYFHLPKAGRIMADAVYHGELWNKSFEAFYWSSSFISDSYIGYLWFNKAQIYATNTNGEMKRGAPIRCFKNPEIIDDSKLENKCSE